MKMKNKWYIADVVILFDKLKGNVKTESGKRFIYPGEWFMPLQDSMPKGKWMSTNGSTPGRICHPATEQEIKEHFK